MSGGGAAEGTAVILTVAKAGAGPPRVTQPYPGPKGKGSHPLCHLSAGAGAQWVA